MKDQVGPAAGWAAAGQGRRGLAALNSSASGTVF
jgi:hypothetical protein